MILLDYLFGWLLLLPSDLTIIVTALLTGVVLTLVRKWTTNQDLLGRAVADNKRLAALIKEAKRAGDKEAVKRYRLTKAQVGMLKFKQEGKPMLVSLLPIALLATWAFARLEFLPPKPGETVTVVANAPVTQAGEVVHLVPGDGLTATAGWVRCIAWWGSNRPPWSRRTGSWNCSPAASTWTCRGRRGCSSPTSLTATTWICCEPIRTRRKARRQSPPVHGCSSTGSG